MFVCVVPLSQPSSRGVRSVRDGNRREKSSRVELHEKLLLKRLALSVDVVRNSGPLKRGGMVDFPLLRTLRCNRASSCFSIIGPRLS